MSNQNHKQDNPSNDGWRTIFLSTLAIFVLRSLFDSDDSRIISNKGRSILKDKDRLNELNQKLTEKKNANQSNSEVYI